MAVVVSHSEISRHPFIIIVVSSVPFNTWWADYPDHHYSSNIKSYRLSLFVDHR
jgi:hypothetical protein